MSRSGQHPDLKKYMDKKLQIELNANRMVIGTLRGFDQFMNLVVDNTVESEEMLKLQTALEGKLRSNGTFGSTVSKSDKAQKRRRKLETFDDLVVKPKMVDNESESEDEFYKQVKQKREAKRAAKTEIYSRKQSSTSSLPLPEILDEKRLISNEMYKNRGLTRHRNKDLKTPRVKNRKKYNQKVIDRKGQVRDIRKPLGLSYGGEGSGINPNISRSIRF